MFPAEQCLEGDQGVECQIGTAVVPRASTTEILTDRRCTQSYSAWIVTMMLLSSKV